MCLSVCDRGMGAGRGEKSVPQKERNRLCSGRVLPAGWKATGIRLDGELGERETRASAFRRVLRGSDSGHGGRDLSVFKFRYD